MRTGESLDATQARRRWTAAWLGAAGIGVVNGVVREAAYRGVGERKAHQISTGTLVATLAAYMWFLDRRWPIPNTRTALKIGSTWTLATIGFEIGLGRFVGPDPKTWLSCWRTMTSGRATCGRLCLSVSCSVPRRSAPSAGATDSVLPAQQDG